MKDIIEKQQTLFECSSKEELARLLGIGKTSLFRIQNKKAGKSQMRMLEIIDIFVRNSTPKSLEKSVKEIIELKEKDEK